MISATSDVQVDTPEVRVTRWRLAPGSATGHHIHEMDYVIVPVTAGEMTIVAPNGERSKAQLGVGQSYFRKAGVEHDVRNNPRARSYFWKWSSSHNRAVYRIATDMPQSFGIRTRAGVVGMLKLVSKFAMDIFPSVIATILGAYIVNHYINNKTPAADTAAAVSTADPKKAASKAESKPAERSADLGTAPEHGVRAKGISEKSITDKGAADKATFEKPAEKADRPSETASIPPAAPADTGKHRPTREKASKATPAPAPAAEPVVAPPLPLRRLSRR